VAACTHHTETASSASAALLSKTKACADKVTILRHKAFAHRTSSMSYDDVFDRAKVPPKEMQELTDLALEAFNTLTTLRGTPTHLSQIFQLKTPRA
jgi:hypothetical protein